MTWKTVLVIILLGFAELALSWLNHRINIFVLSRKVLQATKLDLIANTIAELMPFFIYVVDPKPVYMIPKILMNTLGTYLVAHRKKMRPKKPKAKRIPKEVTTA